MDYLEFKDTLVGELKDFYESDAEIQCDTIPKFNGVREDTIRIQIKGSSVFASINIKLFYEAFSSGKLDMDGCVGRIVEVVEGRISEEEIKKKLDDIRDWNKAKRHIFPILISAKDNTELLESLVSAPFLDMSVIYVVRAEIMQKGESQNFKVNVTESMLEMWDVAREELHKEAMNNLRHEGCYIKPIYEALGMIMDLSTTLPERMPSPDADMLVMTNEEKQYGAAAALDSDFLADSLGDHDYFIIPSSVHELLFVPMAFGCTEDGLNEIIRLVNEAEVAKEERLSDHCYFYSGSERKIKMAA